MTRLSRRQFGEWAAFAAGAISLGGCAPWEQADPRHGLARLTDEPAPTAWEWRVLNRLGYGPRPGDVARLRSEGVEPWIEAQLHPQSIAEPADLQAALARLDTLTLSPEELHDRETDWEPDTAVTPVVQKFTKAGKRREPQPGAVREELAQATVLRSVFSNRSLQEVMVEFWSDHFNINQGKGDCRWLKTVDDRQMRPHTLGRFRDLLGASAHSPAMLVYLDNTENCRADAAGVAHPNENYARELLELHTLGDPLAYCEQDVRQVARLFSGWTIGAAGGATEGQFEFRAAGHDDGEKLVMGQHIAARGGQRDGDDLLDRLAQHPLTARNIAGKLCLRFLGRIPASLRERLTQIFLRSEGDIRQVLAELLRSEHFRISDGSRVAATGDPSAVGGTPLFKRPFHFAISALRMLGARTSGSGVGAYHGAMGQPPYASIQPNGYPLRAEYWSAGLLSRWRFAIDLVRNKIEETWIDMSALERATRGQRPLDVCRDLSQSLLAAPLADEQLAALAALGHPTGAQRPGDALAQCLALLLMSPQFQWC